MPVAPRPLPRPWRRFARGAGLILGLWLSGVGLAVAQDAVSATYEGPTTRYPHGALGDEIEHETLAVTLSDGQVLRATHAAPIVFEDTAPRLVDLTGDGAPEIVTVESHETRGARLALWQVRAGALAPLAATPWIGQRFRWLAPVGAADMDGDGAMEIAYIDRPHLARTLRVWRLNLDADGTARLTQIAAAAGLTNHRLGDPQIPGGLRDCGAGIEMITADATWSRVIATRLGPGDALSSTDLGPWTPGALARALAC